VGIDISHVEMAADGSGEKTVYGQAPVMIIFRQCTNFLQATGQTIKK